VTEASGDHQPAFSHEDLARILTANGFFTTLERTIERAFCQARSRGFEAEALQAVLLTGSGCALPVVQDVVRKRFAACPVHADHPFDAAACGAARSIASIQDPGRIQRDYALRYWDAATREHRYRFLVHSGTRFPSAGQVARVTICAAYDGQSQLGIPLYEMPAPQGEGISALELVGDETGGVRLAGPSPDSAAPARPVPVNGDTPVFLAAVPPAAKGEPRFELTFTIDAGRQLCVTVRDLATNRLLKKNDAIHLLR
jgi:molecular chaperone DnaK (HSP70)